VHTHQRNDDFAIRGGLEVVGLLQALPDQTVVVDLAIDGEDNALISIGKWLSSALCFFVSCRFLRGQVDGSRRTNADDAEPFMAQNCDIVSATLHFSLAFDKKRASS
jgi:hypothetical protein